MTVDINQVAENLSELLTNSTNLASVFFDIFFNTTPMDVQLQQYDADNILQTYTIPNRAKDKESSNALTGTTDPEGNVSASVGTLYINTLSQKAYLKVVGTGVNGWESIFDTSTPTMVSITDLNSPYTILTSDRIIIADTTSGNIEIQLPPTGSNKIIKWYAGDNNLTVNVSGGGTIDGIPDFVFNNNFFVGTSISLYNESSGAWIIT